MPLKSNGDGTYVASWVPSESGNYLIQIFIDSCSSGKNWSEAVVTVLESLWFVFKGKERSLEVMELEPEGRDDQVPQGEETDGQQGSDQDASSLEFTPPKMKLCLGKVAAGLRIRNGPTFMVGHELQYCSHAVCRLTSWCCLKGRTAWGHQARRDIHLL